jgi:hypothetical protein
MSITTFDDLNRDCVQQILEFAGDFPGWTFRVFFGWCKQIAFGVYDYFESSSGLIKYQNGLMLWTQGRYSDSYFIIVRNNSVTSSLCLETRITMTAGCLETVFTVKTRQQKLLVTSSFSEFFSVPKKWPMNGDKPFQNHKVYEKSCSCNWCEQSNSKKYQRFVDNASEDLIYTHASNILKCKLICNFT